MIRMVIPDSGPLISLGKIDRMDLIDRFKCPIIITDVVQMEITDGPDDATDARVLSDWMQRGGNRLQVADTTYGQLLKQNRQLLDMIPENRRAPLVRQFKRKNAGELSILEFAMEIRTWMSDSDTTLVLFEDSEVRSIPFGDHVHLMSNWSLAMSLEKLGVIPSADALFDQIEAAGRNAPRRPFEREPEESQGALKEVYDTTPDL